MEIGRVVGQVVATVKQAGLQGRTLLLIVPLDLADVDGEDGIRQYVDENSRDVSKTVRNVIFSAKDPANVVKSFAAREAERAKTRNEIVPQTHTEHAERGTDDEPSLG